MTVYKYVAEVAALTWPETSGWILLSLCPQAGAGANFPCYHTAAFSLSPGPGKWLTWGSLGHQGSLGTQAAVTGLRDLRGPCKQVTKARPLGGGEELGVTRCGKSN